MHERSGEAPRPARVYQSIASIAVLAAAIAGAGAILVFVADRSPADSPRVRSGLLDLEAWNFARSGPVSLAGDWGFFPQAFVRPGVETGPQPAEEPAFVAVPGDWRRTRDGGRAMPGAYGFASYTLRIRRPVASASLALLVPDEASSWRLYVNGRLRAANGEPAESASGSRIRREAILVPLEDLAEGEGPTELSIHVSNYSYDVGGLINPILIGPSQVLSVRLEAMSALGGFFLGALFLMAMFHFYLFLLRIDDRSSLFFSLFCLLCLLRSLMIAHYPERLFAAGPLGAVAAELSARVEYLGFFLAVPAYLAFVHALFPAESAPRVGTASLAVALAFSAVVLAAPVWFFMAWTTKPYQALTVLQSVYALAVFAKAASRRRRGALYGLVGFAVFFLIIVNDILHANLAIRTAHLAPLGLLIFTIADSFILSSRIATTFAHEKQLSRELSEEKLLLDRRIAERTAELSASNRRLIDLDRAKSRFLATISHELRTPITLILSPLEQAARGRYGQAIPSGGAFLARVLRNGYRLLNIVEGMFDFARLELGRLAPRLETVDLGAALAFYFSEFEALAQKKGVTLRLESELARPCPVSIDPRLFEISFLNILSNALKFTDRGGSIVIGACGPAPDGRLSVAVSDTGIGIGPELLPRIFSKLDWQDEAGEGLYDGAGIGLSLARKIVRLLGGEIEVVSSSGEGSTFTILLPSAREAAAREAAAPATPLELGDRGASILGEVLEEPPSGSGTSVPTREGPSVLVVEDNEELLEFLGERLRSRFRLRTAPDGAQALRSMREETLPELVVTDIMMPKMDGRELFAEARRIFRDACPPFIFLTARGAAEERREAFAEGAVDYLGKPFDVDELALKIESLLAMRARVRSGARLEMKEDLARFLASEGAARGGPFSEGSEGRSVFGSAGEPAESRRSELLGRLTAHEAEIALGAVRGMPDKEIARELGLATRTVSNTLARVYRKLSLAGRLALMRELGGKE